MTSRFLLGALVTCGVLASACSGPGEPDPNVGGPGGAQTSTPTATPTAAPTAEPTATASVAPKPEPPKVVYDVDGTDGVRRMAGWNGPVDGEAITTKKAWVVAPNMGVDGSTKLSFEISVLLLADVVKADAKEVVYELNKNQYAVPASLARAGTLKGLKKGMAARCSFGGSNVVGRIEAVDATSATCAVRFLDETKKVKLTADEVLPLQGDKLSYGSPVVVSTSGATRTSFDGWALAETATDVWVTVERQFTEESTRVNGAIYKVARSNVQLIDPAKALKVGDPCLARQIASMAPCKIASVIDGGVAYTVTFDDGGGSPWKEWSMDIVAPGPKAAAPKGKK